MKKKYCIFSAVYFPSLGGVEWYTYNLAKTLIQDGNEVMIVTSRINNTKEWEEDGGIRVLRVPCINLLKGRYPVIRPGRKLHKIEQLLENEKFDFIIINTRFYMHSIWAARFADKHKIPFLVLEHGTSHLSVHNVVLDRFGALYEHIHTGILKSMCKNFYGTCEACNEWLAHFHIQSKGTLYNAVDMEAVKRALELPPIYRKKYNIPKDTFLVCFSGRVLEEKGIKPLIQAVKRVHNEGISICLMIAGEGPLDSYVQREKTEYIIPLGRIPHDEVFRLLGETDIFCLPSFSEAFCGAVLEAVACKCYVITTERGGVKELITDDRYGTILPDNQEETVYNGLKTVLENWENKQNAVDRVYERMVSEFTWEKTAEKIERIASEKTS